MGIKAGDWVYSRELRLVGQCVAIVHDGYMDFRRIEGAGVIGCRTDGFEKTTLADIEFAACRQLDEDRDCEGGG